MAGPRRWIHRHPLGGRDTVGGEQPGDEPVAPHGVRRTMTPLDWAGLADIGWNVDELAVTSAPPSQVAPGSGFGLTVTAEDPTGAVDTLFNGTVTLALAANPGGATLGGTLTATAVGGVATFSGLTLNRSVGLHPASVERYPCRATTTSAITVSNPSGGGATQLVLTTAPPGTITAGAGFGLTIKAETSSGAVDSSYSGTVTLALAANPGGSTLGGTLTTTAVGGVATFSGLTLEQGRDRRHTPSHRRRPDLGVHEPLQRHRRVRHPDSGDDSAASERHRRKQLCLRSRPRTPSETSTRPSIVA